MNGTGTNNAGAERPSASVSDELSQEPIFSGIAYVTQSRKLAPDGKSYERQQTTYAGIPVYGSSRLLVIGSDGAESAILPAGAQSDTLRLSGIRTRPDIDSAAAIRALASDPAVRDATGNPGINAAAVGLGGNAPNSPPPRTSLLLYPVSGSYRLAYEVEIAGPGPGEGVWVGHVDAATGRVIDRYDRVSGAAETPVSGAVETPAIGWGASADGRYLAFDATLLGSARSPTYEMKIRKGPVAIDTFDYSKPSSDAALGYEYVTSNTQRFRDSAAIDAHYNATKVYLFYKKKFGRDSIDDQGMSIQSFVHVNDIDAAKNNAYWTGWAMYYGDGTGVGNGGVNCTSCALDIVAHELTHGVTQYTVGLEYRNQSGALNEAISDIMAAVIDNDDWTIGEDTGKIVRSLADPGRYGQPAAMSDYAQLADDRRHDNGGVHFNAGIPAHAGYLIAQGVDKAKLGLDGRDILGRLTYALLDYRLISATADFAEAREGYLAAVDTLTGLSEAQKTSIGKIVGEAWTAVGVTSS